MTLVALLCVLAALLFDLLALWSAKEADTHPQAVGAVMLHIPPLLVAAIALGYALSRGGES